MESIIQRKADFEDRMQNAVIEKEAHDLHLKLLGAVDQALKESNAEKVVQERALALLFGMQWVSSFTASACCCK